MKIEAGKYYRTRDGRKAYVDVIRVSSPFNGYEPTHPIIGYVDDEKQGPRSTKTWRADGRFDVKQDRSIDLVEEWREPVSREITLHLVKLKDGRVIVTTDTAPPSYILCHTEGTIVGTQKVCIIEGDGM